MSRSVREYRSGGMSRKDRHSKHIFTGSAKSNVMPDNPHDVTPDSPIYRIGSKPYYEITFDEINPFGGKPVGKVTYVMGSPGSGKTVFLKRLERECGGKLVIESGVWDLFRRYAEPYIQAHGEFDKYFDMPHIDGLAVGGALVFTAIDLEAQGAPYTGTLSQCYREALVKISSGGKSGFPDYLFIPTDGKVSIVVSFPGHFPIESVRGNRSIPKPLPPQSAIYLVDPRITDFDRYHKGEDTKGPYRNEALFDCRMHLGDVLEMEADGVPVHWYLSKTPSGLLEHNRGLAANLYSEEQLERWRQNYAQQGGSPVLLGLSVIGQRALRLPGFDSFESTTGELSALIKTIL